MPPRELPTSSTPPLEQEQSTTDTPMPEAPFMEPAQTTTTPHQTAVTANRFDEAQQQHKQHQQHQQNRDPEETLLGTEMPPAREHPPRESAPRLPIPKLYDNTPSDRNPPNLSNYPTAPNSFPQTPHPGILAPLPPRVPTGAPADRRPHLSSYPTATRSASQTPQPRTSQVPQQGMLATGRLVPPAAKAASRITFDDYLSLSEITFEWGDSYDDKDWMRLRAILAPTLMVDYSQINGHVWSSMPAEEFVRVMSNVGFVGDPLVHTQHHIGASKWSKISDDEAIGHHQLRAAHQRYTASDLRTVENKGHGHAMVKHFYRKVDGEWKLAGLRPTVRWNEFEFEKTSKGF